MVFTAKPSGGRCQKASREGGEMGGAGLVLVVHKGCFGLPTACPSCLPVYLYLRFANAAFDIVFDVSYPDADHIPYIELGDVVFFDNENGGVIEGLKRQNIVNLDSIVPSSYFPEWLSTKVMINSWLAEATQYELWVASDGAAANKIYFSDLPWPIGKALHWKQIRAVKQLLGLTKLNVAEKEIYQKVSLAYEAMSMRLGDQRFFFEDRPTSLDAVFLGHALFVLHALPDTSVLRSNLLKHDNLVNYSERFKTQLLESSSSSPASVPRSPFDASTSSTPRRTSSYWSSKPKPKAKRKKTEEEKTFRRRAKYFLATQLISVVVFLSLFGESENAELEDGDDDGMTYEE